jgi:hypothetical protein
MRLVLLAGFQACYRFLLPAPLIKMHKVPTGAYVVVPRKHKSRTLPGPLRPDTAPNAGLFCQAFILTVVVVLHRNRASMSCGGRPELCGEKRLRVSL